MINWLKNRKKLIIMIVVIAAMVVGGKLLFGGDKSPQYDIVVASRGDLVQEVSVTGRVKPVQEVDLAFENGGKVSHVNVAVGDEVFRGQLLVAQDNADILAQFAEAEANVNAQKAKLDELREGTRPEEIEVQRVKVENARVAREDAARNVADKLQDSYTKSDDAVRNKADQLFTNPRTRTPSLIFVTDLQMKTDIEYSRFVVEDTLVSWESAIAGLTTESDLLNEISAAKQNLGQIKSFLDLIALAVNALTPTTNLSQTTIDGYKADVFTARTNINTATANLTSAEEKFRTAESNLRVEENQLALTEAGTIEAQIKAQQAMVEQARANVRRYQAQLAKAVILAPIGGIVTKQDAKIGEIVSAGTVVISIISGNDFEIEANVAEVDIAEVKIGDMAKVTLDAYTDDDIFEAQVSKIDPAETVIEGVATYKVTLRFMDEDSRIRPGMSTNIDIVTDKRERVISIPQRAVISKDGVKTVKILEVDNVKEVEVTLGIRGSEGGVEIISGVDEGDQVVVFVKK